MSRKLASILSLSVLASATMLYGQGLDTTAAKDDWEEINFESGSAVLSDGYPSLLRLAELLSKNPSFKVKVDGHTDNVGSSRANEKLAMARAAMVKSFLLKYGAKDNQVELATYGKDKPKVDNKTKEGRFMNRRAQLTVLDGNGKPVSAAGTVGDAIRALDKQPTASMDDKCCNEILKRLDKLDDILAAIRELKTENGRLRSDLDAIKGAGMGLAKEQANLRRTLIDDPALARRAEAAMREANGKMKKYCDEGGKPEQLTAVMNDVIAGLKRELAENGGMPGPYKQAIEEAIGRLQKDLDANPKDAKKLRQAICDAIAILQRQLDAGPDRIASRNDVRDELARSTSAGGIGGGRGLSDKFGLLGINAGPDNRGNITFTGKGRFFNPFNKNLALQAEGEYMYFRDRQEGQFDFGLVNRIQRAQFGLFSSFKHVNLGSFDDSAQILAGRVLNGPLGVNRTNFNGGTLGQAAFTADYLFKQGRIGLFGTKSFLDNAVVGRRFISNNIFEESYLKVVDQIGASTAIGLKGNAYLEGNIGYLKSRLGSDKPGGTIRFVFPISALGNKVAFTVEGGFNETMITKDANGRAVFGLQFGNFPRPKEYLASDKPVPVDIPRIRYELLTRRVRTGHSAPVADAGPDQNGVAAGTIQLDGSGSYHPDGDPLTYQWIQIAGPSVAIANATTARPSFPAAEAQSYAFRLTVKDEFGGQGTARVSVTTRAPLNVQIVKYQANPGNIKAGQSSVIVWQVLNADTVDINGSSVDKSSGTMSVAPTVTTMYKITAKNRTSEVTDTLSITVDRPAVRILSFQATPTNILKGESSTLSWTTENADTVSLDGKPVSVNGTSVVSPSDTTTYVLTAKNAFGEVTASTVVKVQPPGPIDVPQPPRIIVFSASPTDILSGETSTLTWKVENADTVNITGVGDVALTGSRGVTPPVTRTYLITAGNKAGTVQAQAIVTVTASVSIGQCTANPAGPVDPGTQVILSYVAQNATDVSLGGVGRVFGPVLVRPTVDTTYTFTATGARNTATCSVLVQVNKKTTVDPCLAVNPPASCSPPTAVAGNNIETLYRDLTLDGSASKDPKGGALTYKWTTADKTAVILDPNSVQTRVQLGEQFGVYTFTLTVTNAAGVSSSANIMVSFVSTRTR